MSVVHLSPPPSGPMNADVPDAIRTRRGWYPRWWLLSAYICTTIVLIAVLLGKFVPCHLHGAFSSLCDGRSWTAWEQVTIIWALFLIGWFFTLIFGMGPIEMSAHVADDESQNDALVRFAKAISEFGPMQSILIIYGMIALICIFVMWFADTLQPAPYALATIYAFVGHCCDFQRRKPGDRVMRLFAYAFIALVLSIFAFLSMDQSWQVGDMHWVVVATTLITIILCSIIAVVGLRTERRRAEEMARRQTSQLGAQQQAQQSLEAALANTVTPNYIIRSFWPFSMFARNRINNP